MSIPPTQLVGYGTLYLFTVILHLSLQELIMKQTHIKCRHCIMFITLYSTATPDEVGLYLYGGMKL